MVWEKIFLIGQDLPMAAKLVVLSERNIKILHRISQTSFLQSKQFIVPQRRFFKFQQTRKKIAHCDHVFVQSGCFLENCDLFDQAVSEKKFFRNRPIRNKNCLWRPCLKTDRNEMSKLYSRRSISASYQVVVHLYKWYQRRRFKCETANDGRQVMAKARMGFRPGELEMEECVHRTKMASLSAKVNTHSIQEHTKICKVYIFIIILYNSYFIKNKKKQNETT